MYSRNLSFKNAAIDRRNSGYLIYNTVHIAQLKPSWCMKVNSMIKILIVAIDTSGHFFIYRVCNYGIRPTLTLDYEIEPLVSCRRYGNHHGHT